MARPIETIAATTLYARSLKKLEKAVQRKLIVRESIFRRDAFDPVLRTHKLKGRLRLFWSWSVDFEHRVLFEFTGPRSALFHDVGTHDIYE